MALRIEKAFGVKMGHTNTDTIGLRYCSNPQTGEGNSCPADSRTDQRTLLITS
jgi:hypothetical protein